MAKYKCSNGHHWDDSTPTRFPQNKISVSLGLAPPVEICPSCVVEFAIAKFGHVSEDK